MQFYFSVKLFLIYLLIELNFADASFRDILRGLNFAHRIVFCYFTQIIFCGKGQNPRNLRIIICVNINPLTSIGNLKLGFSRACFYSGEFVFNLVNSSVDVSYVA